jgi:hypothetical protein
MKYLSTLLVAFALTAPTTAAEPVTIELTDAQMAKVDDRVATLQRAVDNLNRQNTLLIGQLREAKMKTGFVDQATLISAISTYADDVISSLGNPTKSNVERVVMRTKQLKKFLGGLLATRSTRPVQ